MSNDERVERLKAWVSGYLHGMEDGIDAALADGSPVDEARLLAQRDCLERAITDLNAGLRAARQGTPWVA